MSEIRSAAQTAHHPDASPGERHDAQAALQKAHMPSVGDLLPSEGVRKLIDYIQNDFAEQEMAKARGGGAIVIPFPGGQRSPQRPSGMQSVRLDEFQVNIQGDFYEKPGFMGFDTMRKMVDQTPVLGAVVFQRIRQVLRFCKPMEASHGPGFRIQHIDQQHKLNADEKESAKLLTRFFLNCGWEFNPRRRIKLRRDNFSTFVQKLVRDSLTMDSAPIETEYRVDKSRGMDGFYAVDGSTIRLCTEVGYNGDDAVTALQVVGGRIHTAYTVDSLIYQPRNPVADVLRGGYGMSEVELLVRVVTGFLNAMTLNIKGFSDNAIPRGILNVIGDYSTEDISAFKRHWNAMVKGVNNSWTLPVMFSKEKEGASTYTQIGNEFDEMYFAKWMTFLTSIICAIYGMSPEEINFESFAANRSTNAGDDTEERLANSKDKGLRPLLSYVESLLSDFICSDFSDKYVFRWTGLDDEDREKRHEIRKLTRTVNEFRSDEGDEPIKEAWGDAPVNPSLIGAWQMEQQAKNADFGDPDADPAGGGPGGKPPGKVGVGGDDDDDDDDEEAGDGEGDAKEGGEPAQRLGPGARTLPGMRKSHLPAHSPAWWPR